LRDPERLTAPLLLVVEALVVAEALVDRQRVASCLAVWTAWVIQGVLHQWGVSLHAVHMVLHVARNRRPPNRLGSAGDPSEDLSEEDQIEDQIEGLNEGLIEMVGGTRGRVVLLAHHQGMDLERVVLLAHHQGMDLERQVGAENPREDHCLRRLEEGHLEGMRARRMRLMTGIHARVCNPSLGCAPIVCSARTHPACARALIRFTLAPIVCRVHSHARHFRLIC
jgi:hypothetical protein